MNLYTSTKDEAGSSKNVAMSDKEIKKVEDQLNGYKNDLNKGGSLMMLLHHTRSQAVREQILLFQM